MRSLEKKNAERVKKSDLNTAWEVDAHFIRATVFAGLSQSFSSHA
jgi:hypothetical protein